MFDTKFIKNIFSIVPEKLRDRTFIVGGFVRDLLLDKPSNDIDFLVINTTHEEMISLGFKLVGADFPVYIDSAGNEFALARKERKSGKGHLGFTSITENVTVFEDLMRRDFTINAMAIDCNGNLIDPYNGLFDLENGILKHVSMAFSEDPLRVLRLARFTARFPSFNIDESTIKLAFSLKEELKTLTSERIFKEMVKAFKSERPDKFFRTLDQINVLDVVFPELFIMKDFEHNVLHHAEGSVLEHSLRVLMEARKASDKPEVLFAALFHDIGKPFCFKIGNTYKKHSAVDLVKEKLTELKKRISLPNSFFDLALNTASLHHKFHDFNLLNEKTILDMFEKKSFPKTSEGLMDLLIAIQSDSLGRATTEDMTADILSFEENEILFNIGEFSKGSSDYKKGICDLDILLIIDIFEELLIKPNVLSFIEDSETNRGKKPSVGSIKNFVRRDKLKRIKKFL